jgi:hypothetical protein
MNQGTNHSLKMSDEVAAGIGGGASVLSMIVGWLKPLGEIASSVSAIIGCVIAAVMLWRLIFRSDSAKK